jgi:hypothetical protein
MTTEPSIVGAARTSAESFTGAAVTTPGGVAEPMAVVPSLSDFDVGFLVGILVGEGHFGGDGRQPQITLRMHVDHEALFRWLMDRFPDSKLYGPYDHSGRRYYQWMARGWFLRQRLLPILDARLTPELDARTWYRYQQMRSTYP